MPKRRYEILLPLKHNDGRAVSADKFDQTRRELVERFAGPSVRPQPVQGTWTHNGDRYEDDSVCWIVDVDDTLENRQFFKDLQATLRDRFEQVVIYIVSYPIDIL